MLTITVKYKKDYYWHTTKFCSLLLAWQIRPQTYPVRVWNTISLWKWCLIGYETPFSTIVISDCTSKILAKFVSASKKALRKSYLTFFEQTTGMVNCNCNKTTYLLYLHSLNSCSHDDALGKTHACIYFSKLYLKPCCYYNI